MHPEYSRSSAPRDTGSWRLGPGGRQLRGTATPQPYTFEPRKLSPAGPPASYVGSVDQRWCREGSGECGDNNVGLTEARPVPGATLASGDCVGDWPNAEAEAECCEHRPMVNLRPTRNRAPKRPAEGQEGAGSTHLEQPHPTSAHQQHRANRKGHQRGERRKADQRPPNAASGLTSQGSSSKSWRSPTKRERRALEQPHFERTGGASLRQLERDVTAAGGTGACGSTHPSVEQQQPKRLAYSHHKAPFTTQEHVQSSLQHQIRKRKRARDTQQLQHTGWRHELQQQRSGCDEWKRAEEGEGEGEDAPARSCSGSLAANSGSASISGAGSGSLSLGLPGQGQMGNAPVTEMARDSGVQGLTDKVSASRPASCGESGVDVADANASHADLKGSAPAASATGPAGLEGGGEASQVGGEVGGEAGSRAQGKANSHQLGKAESRLPSGQQHANVLEGDGISTGQGESCPCGQQMSPQVHRSPEEEHLSLLLRLRRMQPPLLSSITLNVVVKQYGKLSRNFDLKALDEVERPTPFLARASPSSVLGRLLQAAADSPAKLRDGLVEQYTMSVVREHVLPRPVGAILCTDAYMAAWMTDGDGSGCPEDGSTYLARVELPAAEQSAPPDVSCTCGRDKGPPILWCRHVAGLVSSASTALPESSSILSVNCTKLSEALVMEESVALAEFLYALSVATEEQGVSRSCSQWLAAEIGRLGNISDLNSKAPGEASSAVGDTISSAPGGGRHDRHGQDELGSIEEILTQAEQLMRQPAADWKSLLLAMGVDILGDTCVQPSSAVAGAATQADGVMDAIRPGRTMRDLHVWDQQIVTEEIVQKVWDLAAFGDWRCAWELLCEMTSAASYSACWRRLRQGFQRADAVDDMPMRPADVEDHPEHFEAWQQSQVHQQLHQLPTEKDSFLDAMTAVWEGCTNPAQRAVFFAPLWDSGVPTPTSRAVANAAAAPGWQRGMFSPQPHVGVVSLVGKVVGLVPGVLSGIAAAEALQARCAAESRARHLGIVLSLGNQWSPNAAESIAEAAVPGLAPRLESLHRLMEDLRELSAVLSAHAVWEQQDGLWNEDGSGSGHINVGRSGSSNSSKAPGPARAGSWGGEGDNPEVNSFLEAAALAARGVGLGSGNKSSNRSSSTANRPVPASGSASGSGSISVPGLQSTPGAHLQQWQQQAAEARGVPSLLWISAAALARGVSACSPSDRLKVLAMLVPPPSRHNGGWKGQAALITCLAASTAAAANMFLMGMMAIHHLGNVFAGEGATLLNQLKLGCATLLALAPDEASAIAGSYFLELCVAIVALAPPRAPGAAMGPPTSTLCPKIVVDHALTTIITLLEREGTPTGRPAVSLAALQTLFRLLRRPRLPQVSRTIGLQPVRWIRALVASIRVQRAGGRVSLLVVIKALEVLWAVLARCNMGSLDGVMAEVGPMIVAAVSRFLGCTLSMLETPHNMNSLDNNVAGAASWLGPGWIWPCGDPPSDDVDPGPSNIDPLYEVEDPVTFAREATDRIVAAVGYRPAIEGIPLPATSVSSSSARTRPPVFERALLAPQLGALIAEPHSGMAVRLSACLLLKELVAREYDATCSTLMSAPGAVSALLGAIDIQGDLGLGSGFPPAGEAQNFHTEVGEMAGAASAEARVAEELEASALETLSRLFGGPNPSASHQRGDPWASGGPVQPSQQLWRKMARGKVMRRLLCVIRRTLSRIELLMPPMRSEKPQRAAVNQRAVAEPTQPLLDNRERHKTVAAEDSAKPQPANTACASTLEPIDPSGTGTGAGRVGGQGTGTHTGTGTGSGTGFAEGMGGGNLPSALLSNRCLPHETLQWSLLLVEVLVRHRPALITELDEHVLHRTEQLCGAATHNVLPAAVAASQSAARLQDLCIKSQAHTPALGEC